MPEVMRAQEDMPSPKFFGLSPREWKLFQRELIVRSGDEPIHWIETNSGKFRKLFEEDQALADFILQDRNAALSEVEARLKEHDGNQAA